MKSFTYTFLVLLLSNSSFAVEIPNQFEDGQVTSASQMNENFQALKVEIEALKSQLTSQANNQVNFIGYSEDSMNGGAGFFAMLQACENFASGSHVCNTDEFVKSQYSESAMSTVSGGAWILSSIVALRGSEGGWSSNGIPTSSTRYVNCQNWTTSSDYYYGTSIFPGGGISRSNCSVEQRIACCK